MTAFLTGFPGFLGAALTERLLARGEYIDRLVAYMQANPGIDRTALA